MTLAELVRFAESTSLHDTRRSLTREQARALVREIEARDETPPAFDLTGHVHQTEARGDVRNEFARRAVERVVL